MAGKKATAPETLREILASVNAHPGMMSPIALCYFLQGSELGRMCEKGLLGSPWFGKLADVGQSPISDGVRAALEDGLIVKAGGFYPGLSVTPMGLRLLPPA